MTLRAMVRRFTLKIKEGKMVVIELGYRKYVLPRDKAMALVEALESAETYEARYWDEAKRLALGMTETYTYHVYPSDSTFSMSLITDSHYQMAKLAGKPVE